MSILRYPEALNPSDLQIWNNAAFDNGDFEDPTAIKTSWSPLKSVFVDRSDSFGSASTKENHSSPFEKSCVPSRSSTAVKPLHLNNVVGNSQKISITQGCKKGFVEKVVSGSGSEEEVRDEKKIDAEIEEIEKEISRLTSRLDALKLEKILKNAKISEKRGRVIPAKFLESSKTGERNTEGTKKIDETSSASARTKFQNRRVTLGPAEIIARTRRGMSLGPSEIVAGAKSRGLSKPEITPIQPIQNRRKSCFWKLHGIDEGTVTKERGKSTSVSPKSRKMIAKAQDLRQVMTTVGGKKTFKKEDGVINSIQPKKLFKEGEKSVTAKKQMKAGRVVASRYNLTNVSITSNSSIRKRSLPENGKDESKQSEKKRSLSVGKSRVATSEVIRNHGSEAPRVKKRWEIPTEVTILKDFKDGNSSSPLNNTIHDFLPRIRTFRDGAMESSPRDSGPAKRVAELVGRKSFFCDDEEADPPVCQALSFAEAHLQ